MNARIAALVVGVATVCALVSACNDTTPPPGCTPGAVVACACSGGGSGAQTCEAGGVFGPCLGCAPTDGGAPFCGDGTCSGGETCATCVGDCGACSTCGDGACNGGETCATCAGDCGACATCGDGTCNGSETCATCASDCGACPPTCGPATCDGCCEGTVCRTGDVDAGCGTGGVACDVCTGDFGCDYLVQSCTLGWATTWGIVIDDVTVSTTNYLGAAWDAFGGAPDPKVCVWVNGETTSHCTGSATDVFTTTFSPGFVTTAAPADIAATLGISVYDVDVSSDDLVGSCTTTFDASSPLPTTTRTMTCPLDAATMNSGFTVRYHLTPI